MDRPSVKKSAAGPLVYFIDEVGVGEAEVNRWNLPWLWSLGGVETTRSKYGRQNTPMLLGSFLAGEASWNLQSQSLQCINHYYDLFIRSVYLSDVFFHNSWTSEAVPAARNLGRRALRGRPEHTAGMLGGRSATTWGRSFPQTCIFAAISSFLLHQLASVGWVWLISWISWMMLFLWFKIM